MTALVIFYHANLNLQACCDLGLAERICTVAPQEAQPTLNSGLAPALLFDYYNFPPEAYRIEYPAPGSPGLAERAASLLRCIPLLPWPLCY